MKKLIYIITVLFILFSLSAFAADWVKNINVYVRDEAGNLQLVPATSSITLDSTSPVINLTNNVDWSHTNTPKVITATLTEVNPKEFKYALVSSSTTCNSSVDYSNNYISWTDLIFANETFNWKKICFKAEDLSWNITYIWSNKIENIDTITPSTPSYNYAYQNGYNSITFKGSCTYEPGLKFIVKDNWVIIHEESLSNPCNFDYTYTLTSPPLIHDIEYYITDLAGNKTETKTFRAYVDNVWYLITPANWVTVTPIISFMWFNATPNAIIKIKKIWWDYIASWTSDAKWYFILQTSQSQPLWSMQIDVEINWIMRGDIRSITVASSSIVIPYFSNESDIQRSNTKLITAEVRGNPLSHVKMYSKDASGNRLELWETQLDNQWNWSIPSNISLPGGENILYIQDTVYNVSSQILLIVVVDPFWYAYNSVTKEKISWVKVYVTDCNGNNISLPNVNGIAQSNPVITNSSWYYDSYELPGTYCIKVQKDWYTWPSTIIASWSLNLDNSPNVWSHGQPFVVSSTPIHIDIPMDPVSTPWGWGWSSFDPYDYRTSVNWGKISTSAEGKKMEVTIPAWIKTLTKTYNTWFDVLYIEKEWYFRFMYHKSKDDIKEIPFNETIMVSITDLSYNWQPIFIKTSEDKEWIELKDYNVNWKTINFKIDKWFILKINYDFDVNQLSNEIKEIPVIENKDGYKLYSYKKYDIPTMNYVKNYSKNKKLFEKLSSLDKEIALTKFPIVLSKLEKIISTQKLSEDNEILLKTVYNYLWWLYNLKYSEYVSTLTFNK